MKKEPNKKRIAMFIILGFAVMAGILLKVIADKWITENKNLAVMYFSESIKGLSVGSPVVYEGVQVGKVVNIEILTNPKTLEFSIPVYVRFAEDGNISTMSFDKELSRTQILHALIEKGLRARLTNQNFLTGQLMIELQMLPNTPIILKHELTEKRTDRHVFEIPTTLSTIGNLSKDFQDLPLKQIIGRMDNILAEFETQLPLILPRFADLGQKLNTYTDRSAPQTAQTLNQLNRTLKDVGAAAKSLKNLTDYLERHPDALLKGKKEN